MYCIYSAAEASNSRRAIQPGQADVWRAEATRLLTHVRRDLLEALIGNPHRSCVPSHPDLVREILGRHRVERLINCDGAIAMHASRAFLEARETLPSKRLECWSSTAAEHGADLLLRRAMNVRVRGLRFPRLEVLVRVTGRWPSSVGVKA